MSVGLIVGVSLALFLLLLIFGAHIHTALFSAGILGILLLEGPSLMSGMIGPQAFTRTASYSLTTIPLFVLMAQFVLQAGIVRDLFYLVSKTSRGRVGPLGALTIGAGGMLGAVSGSGSATSAALGQVAVPELSRYGMSKPMAGAVAASAGSLAGIIPPSIILIIYGVATETAIGDLFLGATIPGLITVGVLIVIFLAYIGLERRRNREAIAPYVSQPIGLRRSFVAIVVGLAIVLIIFGGIFLGWFTPTESGAIGAMAAFLAAIALGKVTRTFMTRALLETVKVTGMVLLILIAAQIFGRFISLSLLPRQLIEAMGPLLENELLLIIVLAAVFFVMFMFLEGAAVILMLVPIVLPLLQESNIDMLWFGVFVAFLATIGTITPPVGLSVFAVSGATGIPSAPIFRYTLSISAITTIVVIVLMVLFPDVVTILPELAH